LIDSTSIETAVSIAQYLASTEAWLMFKTNQSLFEKLLLLSKIKSCHQVMKQLLIAAIAIQQQIMVQVDG